MSPSLLAHVSLSSHSHPFDLTLRSTIEAPTYLSPFNATPSQSHRPEPTGLRIRQSGTPGSSRADLRTSLFHSFGPEDTNVSCFALWTGEEAMISRHAHQFSNLNNRFLMCLERRFDKNLEKAHRSPGLEACDEHQQGLLGLR
ncbi:hypothetical protein E2P81_ATG01919 [Venturia nashicola]|nr:hypothetical protein E2P81_ATG01919 [Venturia nashicola]